MVEKNKGQGRVETVFVLMLFCVFAISVFIVLILSASAYQNMNEVTAAGQNERIALSYVRTKLRNNDYAEAVSVATFGDVQALVIEERIDGEVFYTIIYYHDGWAYELFTQAGTGLGPGSGQRFVRVEALEFYMLDYGMIYASAGSYSALIYLRSVTREEPANLDDFGDVFTFVID